MIRKTDIQRHPERGSSDRLAAYAILDEALLCHVGFDDEGPVVIPMLHARLGDDLLLHGSPASRLLRTLSEGAEICVTVTIFDGLVLARSAFNSSANYRSVVVFGSGHEVTDLSERRTMLDAFTDKLLPGRRPYLRPMTDKEVRATSVVSIPIEDFSVKTRSGPPSDAASDMSAAVWAGVVPVRLSPLEPQPDPHTDSDVPDHVRRMMG
ncbi:MAG: pyridoxamine 5'-phosphate oxidase family protein [Acidimicrobiia bacterium]|nr:pyridoxamine 5'-phosphate oxidase family protein [Acidimicrobiia bacterium]MDH5616402.1 pyridoxamine 5'-phosphate oxidase family protein [Acidimicrobiia bacterium]